MGTGGGNTSNNTSNTSNTINTIKTFAKTQGLSRKTALSMDIGAMHKVKRQCQVEVQELILVKMTIVPKTPDFGRKFDEEKNLDSLCSKHNFSPNM